MRLSTLNVPTLVMNGRDDPLIPFAAGEGCTRSIPGAKLLLIDGWGHNIPPLIEPLLAREVATFFDEIA
jgi:pimeloyl-ACP methyl ester carboxylesterase